MHVVCVRKREIAKNERRLSNTDKTVPKSVLVKRFIHVKGRGGSAI